MPVTNTYNTDNTQNGPVLGSLSNPAANRSLSFPSSYEYVKRFIGVQNANQFIGKNGVTSLDDPTYLGFSLLFIPNSALFNGAEGNTEVGLTGGFANIADTLSNKTESAVGYLERIGETKRANYLRAFVQGIQLINRSRPYYFQGIEGLSDAWNKTVDIAMDPFMGSGDEGITIGCLEAIDLKISALFTLYKMAVYDSKYRRFILPKNLMKFDVYVSIQEIRKFNTFRSRREENVAAAQGGSSKLFSSNFVNENTSQITFKFLDCEWDLSSSGIVFDTVSNSEANVTSTQIKFSYSNILFSSQFSGYTPKLIEDRNQKIKSELSASIEPKDIVNQSFLGDEIERVKEFSNKINKETFKGGWESANDIKKQQLSSVGSLAEQRAGSLLDTISLGNAFGLRANVRNSIDNPQALANALNGAALNITEDEADTSNTKKIGEKIMPAAQLPTNNDGKKPKKISGTQRLFTKQPPGPSLTSTNIFEQ